MLRTVNCRILDGIECSLFFISNIKRIWKKSGLQFLWLIVSVSHHLMTRAVVVYWLEYWPVIHDVAGSIAANLMDGEWKTMSA